MPTWRGKGLALALAHGDKPRYGGKFLSVGNEEVPSTICTRRPSAASTPRSPQRITA